MSATRSGATLVALLAAAAAFASCGDGDEGSARDSKAGPTAVQHVTRDFGRKVLAAHDRAPLPRGTTALRLLTSYEKVLVDHSRRFVLGINGMQRSEGGPTEKTWAMNVNGIESDTVPAEYELHPGDVVQWDYRDWYVLFDVRATVGAFPETFTRGVFGARFPTTVECTRPQSGACLRVKRVLTRAGVDVDGARPPGARPPGGNPQRARILVGPWNQLRDRRSPRWIDRGPRYSGVFARFTDSGDGIRLLDWDAQPIRTVGAGSGLVAAQRPSEEDLNWVVTGVDEEGVERAARALTSPEARDAFALVVTRDGPEKVPLPRPDPNVPRDRITE